MVSQQNWAWFHGCFKLVSRQKENMHRDLKSVWSRANSCLVQQFYWLVNESFLDFCHGLNGVSGPVGLQWGKEKALCGGGTEKSALTGALFVGRIWDWDVNKNDVSKTFERIEVRSAQFEPRSLNIGWYRWPKHFFQSKSLIISLEGH